MLADPDRPPPAEGDPEPQIPALAFWRAILAIVWVLADVLESFFADMPPRRPAKASPAGFFPAALPIGVIGLPKPPGVVDTAARAVDGVEEAVALNGTDVK